MDQSVPKLGSEMQPSNAPTTEHPPCCCQQIDYDDEEENFGDYGDEIEGRYSPKKVTFSEYDQVKLMSMESLLSAATSDASTMEDGNGGFSTAPQKVALPANQPKVVVGNASPQQEIDQANTPKRNQKARDKLLQ